jgi:LemA protein
MNTLTKVVLGSIAALLVSAIACAAIAVITALGLYNGMQSKNQAVETAWAKVESQYQRRFDLIPNLVETVKAAANFEKSTLTEIATARASVGRATVDIKNATPEQLTAFQNAHTGLSAALSKLMVVTENYPQLKANENFVALTAELAGTENRVAVARNDFNIVVQDYNTILVRFPGSLLANYFGFKQKPYFKAAEKAAEAPKVQF